MVIGDKGLWVSGIKDCPAFEMAGLKSAIKDDPAVTTHRRGCRRWPPESAGWTTTLQYFPPVLNEGLLDPPQTIIWLSVQTAV